MAGVVRRACLCLAVAWASGPRLPVPEFEINLDRAPEERFTEVVEHFRDDLHRFIDFIHGSSSPIVKAFDFFTGLVAKHRGRENDEFQAEIEGMAKLAGVDVDLMHALQFVSEIGTLFPAVVNFTGGLGDAVNDFSSFENLQELFPLLEGLGEPMPLFFCMGIVATDRDDGTVYHARNLDFPFVKYLQPLVYTAIFTKKGKELFRAQTMASYSSILTGMRKGPNGFTVEINTRRPDHSGGNREMLQHLLADRREISGWTRRKILENYDNYEDAVEAMSNTPYVATEYNIVAGVKKGVVLARNPDGLAFKLPLNESKRDYIIMSNFDYIWHDVKELLDHSVKGLFRSRRKAAERLLDAAPVLSPEFLFEVLNDDGVMAQDTIFQVIMNVETGLWNASLPACVSCPRGSDVTV